MASQCLFFFNDSLKFFLKVSSTLNSGKHTLHVDPPTFNILPHPGHLSLPASPPSLCLHLSLALHTHTHTAQHFAKPSNYYISHDTSTPNPSACLSQEQGHSPTQTQAPDNQHSLGKSPNTMSMLTFPPLPPKHAPWLLILPDPGSGEASLTTLGSVPPLLHSL